MEITVFCLHVLIRLVLSLLRLVVTLQSSSPLHDPAKAADPPSVPGTAACLESRFGNLEAHTKKGVSV